MGTETSNLKLCRKCGETKSVSEFFKRSDCNGYRHTCKLCSSKRAKTYYLANKSTMNAQSVKWAKDNPEKMLANRKRRYISHREKYREAARASYWKNRDVELDRQTRSRKEYPEKWRAWWRKSNSKHKDRCNANYHNYKARKRGNGGKHTAAEWRELCNKYGNRCLCCGSTEHLTKDHVVPLSLGGTNAIDNIQPLCLSCNSRKGNREIVDYRIASGDCAA